MKSKLFSCLTNIQSFSEPRKGRNIEIDASVLMSEVKECTRNSNIPFKACENFMKTESLSLCKGQKLVKSFLWALKLN
jgi:hypothetical protein